MKSFKRALLLSLTLHLLFLGLLSLQFPERRRSPLVKVKLVSISQASLEATPRKTSSPKKITQIKKKSPSPKRKTAVQKRKKNKAKAPRKKLTRPGTQTKTKAKSKTKPKTSVSPKQKKQTRVKKSAPPKSAREKTLLQEKLARLEEEVLLRKKVEKLKEQVASRKGSANLQGNTEGERLSSDQYNSRVTAHLKSFWEVPLVLKDRKNLTATAIIKLGPDGKLLSFKLTKPSGNMLFDETVKIAIKEADPYPPRGKSVTLKAIFTPEGLSL